MKTGITGFVKCFSLAVCMGVVVVGCDFNRQDVGNAGDSGETLPEGALQPEALRVGMFPEAGC